MRSETTAENPYLDAFVARFPEWASASNSLTPQSEWRDLWDQWRWKYSHAIPTLAIIKRIVGLGQPVVEIGAGSGYWSWLLERAGGSVTAYDSFIFLNGTDERPPLWDRKKYEPWLKVIKGGPDSLRDHPEHTLLLCWPDHEPGIRMDAEAAEKHSGTWLIYVGEVGPSRRTGSDEFFTRLASHYVLEDTMEIPRWPGHHDAALFYRKMVDE